MDNVINDVYLYNQQSGKFVNMPVIHFGKLMSLASPQTPRLPTVKCVDKPCCSPLIVYGFILWATWLLNTYIKYL